jgi:hypothetical protein
MKYNYFKKLTLKHWVIAFVLVCILVTIKLAMIMETKHISDVSTLMSKIENKVSEKIGHLKLVQNLTNITSRKPRKIKNPVKAKTLYKDWVKLSWVAPTENTDGTPLQDLAGFHIYYWTGNNSAKKVRNVKNVLSYKLENLHYGETYYFAVTAYNKKFAESDYSDIKAVKLEKPD